MPGARGVPVAIAPAPGQVAGRGFRPCIRAKATGLPSAALMPAPCLVAAGGGRGQFPRRGRSVQARALSAPPPIERFSARLRRGRRVATRYERTACNALAAVLIASTRAGISQRPGENGSGRGRAGLAVVWGLVQGGLGALTMHAGKLTLLTCIVSIPVLSALPLAAILWALRQGAPSSPAAAGAAGGLMAGALAAGGA